MADWNPEDYMDECTDGWRNVWMDESMHGWRVGIAFQSKNKGGPPLRSTRV